MNGKSYTSDEFRQMFSDAVREAGGNTQFCLATGLSPTLVSLVCSGKQKPGPKCAKAIGFRKQIVFVPLQDKKAGA